MACTSPARVLCASSPQRSSPTRRHSPQRQLSPQKQYSPQKLFSERQHAPLSPGGGQHSLSPSWRRDRAARGQHQFRDSTDGLAVVAAAEDSDEEAQFARRDLSKERSPTADFGTSDYIVLRGGGDDAGEVEEEVPTTKKKKSTTLQTAFNVVNMYVGLGLLSKGYAV